MVESLFLVFVGCIVKSIGFCTEKRSITWKWCIGGRDLKLDGVLSYRELLTKKDHARFGTKLKDVVSIIFEGYKKIYIYINNSKSIAIFILLYLI